MVKKKATTKKPVAKKKVAALKPVTKKESVPKKKATVKPASRKEPSKPIKQSIKKITVNKKVVSKKKTALKSKLLPGDISPYKVKRGEEYMNPDQISHFITILLAIKQELIEDADRTVHHMQDDAANFPDPSDRATQESEFSLELRTRDRERKLIKKIDGSLASLDKDDYGYCEKCGVEIGIQRLEARPTADQCIDCKTLDEIKEKHNHA